MSDLEFREDGTLSRRAHVNPDGSQWSTKYEYDYRADQLAALRHVHETSTTMYIHEYDSEDRLRRVVFSSAGATRVIEEYDYNAVGGKTKTQFVHIPEEQPNTVCTFAVEGAEGHYSAPGPVKVTTVYNLRDQPIELLFLDVSDHLLNRVTFTYDAEGHLLEELQTRSSDAFECLFGNIELPSEQAEAVHRIFQSVAEPIRIGHRYDEHGQRVETRTQFGLLREEVERRSYNERGDEIAEFSEEQSRDYGPDAEGQLSPLPGSERVTRSETRFQYEYDSCGNWTKKSVEGRSSVDEEFSLSSVEERSISYFE